MPLSRKLTNSSETKFGSDGKVFEQRDGAPMGGCVSPTLANAFLCFHENVWLSDCPENFKPILYRRYVDDTFLLFKHKSHIELFLNYLNNKHSRIKFTCEVEERSFLNFLDLKITKNDDTFNTEVYRKPTTTGLGLKFNSAVSETYKFALINCLIDRAYKLSSSIDSFFSEVEKLKSFFCQNNYPLKAVENTIKLKIDKLLSPSDPVTTVPKLPLYLKIPFLSIKSNSSLKEELSKLISEYYPQVELNLIFHNKNTVASFFRYKDQVPTRVLSNVVYQYTCPECSVTYVGETGRHMYTRVAEHMGISPRTGLPVTHPKSNIFSHFTDTGHRISETSFKTIISSQNSNLKLLESICIHQLKPILNDKQYSTPLNILL